MIAALLAASVLGSPIDAREGAPTALVLLQPGTVDPALPDRVLAAAAQAWRDLGLRARPAAELGVDPAAIAGCPPKRLLSCALSEVGDAPIAVLMISSAIPLDGGKLQLATWLIDVEAARAELERGEDGLENRLFRRSILVPGAELEPEKEGALLDHFAALRPELLRAIPGAEPLGSITLELPWPRAEVRLDDRALGAAEAGALAIADVRAGLRQLELTDPTGATHRIRLEVRPGRITRASLATASDSPPPVEHGALRSGLRWAGLGMVAAGAALGVVGLASGGGVREGCLVRPGAEARCEGLGTPSFGFDAEQAPSVDPSAVNPGGLAPLPLGLALGVGGLAWALGLSLIGDDGDSPWPVVLGGLALGGLAYALGAAAP